MWYFIKDILSFLFWFFFSLLIYLNDPLKSCQNVIFFLIIWWILSWQALKKLKGIEKNYEDFIEDQFDFHSYCLRKMTIRSYVRLLRFEDNIMVNEFFLFLSIFVSFSLSLFFLSLISHFCIILFSFFLSFFSSIK